ncbi:MAG: hypothetical protein R6V41_04775 [Desulfobacteraceae bacterium]
MSKNIVEKVDDRVKINTVLVSVSDKSGLETLIPGLIKANPELMIMSTGGTYKRISEILGDTAGTSLYEVSEYTGQPETQGGLVKTLDFKIYLGLLTETYNQDHQDDMKRTFSRPVDMVVANLYPFEKTVAGKDVTVEKARGNIDIGGPAMIRAAAKNFLRVAPVVDPDSYPGILEKIHAREGCLALEDRFEMAQKAFEHTAAYDRTISEWFGKRTYQDAASCYKTEG